MIIKSLIGPGYQLVIKKMAKMTPGDTWFEYDIKKCLGPYGKSNLY